MQINCYTATAKYLTDSKIDHRNFHKCIQIKSNEYYNFKVHIVCMMNLMKRTDF